MGRSWVEYLRVKNGAFDMRRFPMLVSAFTTFPTWSASGIRWFRLSEEGGVAYLVWLRRWTILGRFFLIASKVVVILRGAYETPRRPSFGTAILMQVCLTICC